MDILHVSLERIIFENIRKIGVTPNQKKILNLKAFSWCKSYQNWQASFKTL